MSEEKQWNELIVELKKNRIGEYKDQFITQILEGTANGKYKWDSSTWLWTKDFCIFLTKDHMEVKKRDDYEYLKFDISKEDRKYLDDLIGLQMIKKEEAKYKGLLEQKSNETIKQQESISFKIFKWIFKLMR